MSVFIFSIWEVSIRAREVELYLHDKFSSSRLRGEWFSPRSISSKGIEKALRLWKISSKPELEFTNTYKNTLFEENYHLDVKKRLQP